MNCKQGDLAVIVRSKYGNEGRIVTCVKFLGLYEFADRPAALAWFIEPAFPSLNGTLSNFVADDSLRPIRDPGDDARDETLSWKRVPSPAKQGETA